MNKTLLAATAALAWTGAVLAQTALPTLASPTPAAPPLEAPPLAGAPSVGLPPPAAEVVTSPAPPTSVVPVTALARVLSVTAAAQPVIGNRVVCTETAEVAAPTTGAGAVAGAIVGATVGHQIGGGAGNALATAAGAVGGALVGDQVEQGGARRWFGAASPNPAQGWPTKWFTNMPANSTPPLCRITRVPRFRFRSRPWRLFRGFPM